MALIKQIKVGGTTYDVAVKAGNGIAISPSGEVSVLISGHNNGFAHGLEYKDRSIALKIASGLKFDSLGQIAINVGSGLGINNNGELFVNG